MLAGDLETENQVGEPTDRTPIASQRCPPLSEAIVFRSVLVQLAFPARLADDMLKIVARGETRF